MPGWPRYPLVYEINTRVWLRELSGAAGRPLTLAEVPDAEMARLAGLGFDAVWLMGVWTVGEGPVSLSRRPEIRAEYQRVLPDVTEADLIGSPYAVTEYEVSPSLGGPAALAALRARLASAGLRLMLDFVGNHTALDHPLTRERPEVFVRGTEEDLAREPTAFFRTSAGAVLAHGRDPYFPPWNDTAQVNYGGSAGRETMRHTLSSIAAQCDGVRCDMAMLLLPDVMERTWGDRLGRDWVRESFWTEAIPEVRAGHRDFRFLAEVYWGLESRLHAEGFDFTYDKTLYDGLLTDDPAGVKRWLTAPAAFQDHCCRFVENHDEPRAAAAFGVPRLFSAATAALAVPGMRLLHEGQLEGRRARLPVQLARRPEEPVDARVLGFYERLLAVLRDPVMKHGQAESLEVRSAEPGDGPAPSLIALLWRDEGSARPRSLIVINLSGEPAYGRIPLDATAFAGSDRWTLSDRADGQVYLRETAEMIEPGLFVFLDGHRSHLFELIPVTAG